MKPRILDRAEGQSLVLIALLMVAMIAFLGLLIDGGAVMVNRRSSQNASDAAAFAGVRALALRSDNTPATENSIWITITNLATTNGILTTTDVVAAFIDQNGNDICRINQNCNGVPTSPYPTGVRVTTTLRLQPYFISVVTGKAPIPIRSVAATQSGSPSSQSQLMPMALEMPTQTLTYNTPYQLQGAPTTPGGFQWASYDCASSSGDIVNYLTLYNSSGPVTADPSDAYYNPLKPTQYNWPGPPSPNPWACSGPGVKPDANISIALDAWLDLSKWGVSTKVNWGPKPAANNWTIPVYDHDNSQTGSGAQYHIVMFAEFQFLGYWFANNQCNYLNAPNNPNCTKNLPAPLQNCADTNQKCIMGQFLKEADPAQVTPGQCNTNGINICGFGLSQ